MESYSWKTIKKNPTSLIVTFERLQHFNENMLNIKEISTTRIKFNIQQSRLQISSIVSL